MAVTTGSAGALLRDARTRAGLSQTELARLAGVAQSVVSAYESGRRQPSLSTLARLVAATGSELEITLVPSIPLRRNASAYARLSGPLGRKVRKHRVELREAATKHGASNLRIFGNVARGDESPQSDVDILADLAAGVSLFTLGKLQRELEAILGAPVEIVPASDLKPGVWEEVEADAVAL